MLNRNETSEKDGVVKLVEEAEERIAYLIKKCPNMRVLFQIHAHILTQPLSIFILSFSLSKITSFCALSPCGDILYALRVFSQTPNPNIFSWNSIIRGFSCFPSPPTQSISIFKSLIRKGYPRPNSFTLSFVLKACSIVSAFDEGQQVHSRAIRCGYTSSPFLQTSLVSFYSKCEKIEFARDVFDEIPHKNMVAWSSMIAGYAKLDMCGEALNTFRDMQKAGVVPDEMTMVSVVSACASFGALDVGVWIHTYIDRRLIVKDLELSTALINMYAKCGCIEKAKEVFDTMPIKDAKAWSSMIVGFGIHGRAQDALDLFAAMEEAKVIPNHVAFLGVLLACAHCRLVSEGKRYWLKMLEVGIEPSMEHYGCLVDLLCRANLIEVAYRFIRTMPIYPNTIIWRTLLVGCKKKKDIVLGERVAEKLLQLEPHNAENYVLLSSLYASCSEWTKMRDVRKRMKEKGIKTVPGCSSIEIDGTVHEFVLGDLSHPDGEKMRELLRDIFERTHCAGYKPNISEVFHDVSDGLEKVAPCDIVKG